MRNVWFLEIIYLFSWHTGLLSAFYPCQTPSIRLFVSWLIYRCLFIYILCFFWCLAWCATLCFVNGFRPRAAVNDMVVIVCQCDNVRFPISMWSWTFDEGGDRVRKTKCCHLSPAKWASLQTSSWFSLAILYSQSQILFFGGGGYCHDFHMIPYCMKEPLSIQSDQTNSDIKVSWSYSGCVWCWHVGIC